MKMDTPKPRKVLISFEEYKSIELALAEIGGIIGSGDLSKEQLIKYKACEKSLLNLLTKIINN